MSIHPRAGGRALIGIVVLELLAALCFAGVTYWSSARPAVGGVVHADVPTVAAAEVTTCRTVPGPFHTEHAAIRNRAGKRYIPYGLNLVDFARRLKDRQQIANAVSRAEARIRAAKQSWCANTIRLMVSQRQLVRGPNSDMWVQKQTLNALKTVVGYANARGLVVAITLQTQRDHVRELYMPTRRSLMFWRWMAGAFNSRHHPDVVFDLINEPGQVSTKCPHRNGKPCSWGHWRNGFRFRGMRYFGMQEVAHYIRSRGAKNLLWVEGTTHGSDLSLAWRYRLRHVGAVAYSVHRPSGIARFRTWRAAFGYLAERNLAPVLDGEWAQYAVAHKPWACWKDIRTSGPRWLYYLKKIHSGMIATKMTKGVLVSSKTNFAHATQIKSNWHCRNGLNQGAGQMIMDWYHKRNGIPATEPSAAVATG